MKKQVYVLGGGTFSDVRNHLALAIRAFGTTARKLHTLCEERFPDMGVNLQLTKMADGNSSLVTNEDVAQYTQTLHEDAMTKVIFFNVGLCDYEGSIDDVPSGKYAERLKTKESLCLELGFSKNKQHSPSGR